MTDFNDYQNGIKIRVTIAHWTRMFTTQLRNAAVYVRDTFSQELELLMRPA